MNWSCPSCGLTHTSAMVKPMHHCPALHGIAIALSPAGQSTRHVLVEREDYVGTEHVTLLDDRPVMALRTERADGSNDCIVFAPTATGLGGANP